MAQLNPSSLKDHLTDLYNLIASLKTTISDLQLENDSLKHTIQDLKQKVAITTANHIDTHQALANKIVENTEIKQENNYLQDLIDRLSQKLGVLQSSLVEKEAAFADANEHITHLQGEVSKLQQLKDLPEAVIFVINALHNKINTLERELQRVPLQSSTNRAQLLSAQGSPGKKETDEFSKESGKTPRSKF